VSASAWPPASFWVPGGPAFCYPSEELNPARLPPLGPRRLLWRTLERPRFEYLPKLEGVELWLAEDAVAVAFHEASRNGAEALRPTGICAVCRNRAKFRRPPKQGDLPYIVMDSRGRPFPATSAVDIVLRMGVPVHAPVDGTVRNVKRYRLYGRYPDVRVAIAPDADPGRRVVLIHLRGVTVRRGDRVEASTTVIGRVRSFPFESQVDRYVRGSFPHVHIEVRHGAEADNSSS
jgi:hypothetical protein